MNENGTLEHIVQLDRHRIRQRLFPLISQLENASLTREQVAVILAEMYRVLL